MPKSSHATYDEEKFECAPRQLDVLGMVLDENVEDINRNKGFSPTSRSTTSGLSPELYSMMYLDCLIHLS